MEIVVLTPGPSPVYVVVQPADVSTSEVTYVAWFMTVENVPPGTEMVVPWKEITVSGISLNALNTTVQVLPDSSTY
jgi:hypothetical protein